MPLSILSPNFGITAVQEKEYWLVRLMSETETGERKYRNRTVCWKSWGGRSRSIKRAQALRDELLHHPDVIRYRQKLTDNNGVRVRSSYRMDNKIAFPNLVGINLVEERPKETPFYSIRAIFGSLHERGDTRQSESFSLRKHGVWGALTKAIAHREKLVGRKLYNRDLIRQDYEAAVKKYGKTWVKMGISLNSDPATHSHHEAWREMSAAELRKVMPPSPEVVGVSLVITENPYKNGPTKAVLMLVGYYKSYGHREHCFSGSLAKGLWPAYRDCLRTTLKQRNEPVPKSDELIAEYKRWIRGYTKTLQDLGFDTSVS